MSKEDNSISFGMGLLAGIVGGVVAAILYAPKSGAETREDVKNYVNDFAQRHAPEIKEAKKQALESLDMMKYKLEKQYNKINEQRDGRPILRFQLKINYYNLGEKHVNSTYRKPYTFSICNNGCNYCNHRLLC